MTASPAAPSVGGPIDPVPAAVDARQRPVVRRARASAPQGPPGAVALPAWPWLPLFSVAVLVTVVLGRLTAIETGGVSLAVPAAGTAVVWMLMRRASPVSVDAGVLTVILAGVGLVSQVPVPRLTVLVVGLLVQVGLTVLLVRRWCPHLWGVGGDGAVATTSTLVRLATATIVGGLVGALVSALGVWVVDGRVDVVEAALLVGRDVSSGVVVVPTVLVIARAVARRRPSRPADEGGPLEGVLLVVASVVVYVVAFVPSQLPLAFPLLLATAWAALRFSTALAAAHGLAAGVAVVVFTLRGVGPFATTSDGRLGALIAQAFVSVVVAAGLTLGVGRDERRSLLAGVRRAERAAAAQSGLLRAIIDQMHEGVMVVEAGGRILLRNPAAEMVYPTDGSERAPYDAEGRRVPPERYPSTLALAGTEARDRLTMRPDDGSPDVVVDVAAIPLPTTPGEPARAVVVVRDITAEHQQRLELSAFAGVVAHDLKNPLAAVDGWVEMLDEELEDGGTPPRALTAQAVTKIGSASTRMRSLIRHLLQHATSQDAALELADVPLTELARDVVDGRDAAGGVTVLELPAVHGDRGMLRQLLDNLVGNALKYVVPGEEPVVTVSGEAVDGGMVLVRVTDQGVGIPDAAKDLVFQQFYRAHATAYTGTGLGLAICRRIVDRHGGTITVHDNPHGRGTEIAFTLPAARGIA
ncbi:sensor histidine kinase [Nocardioides alkalitolerans]|uniref:sensor histidine kinase n=1 Tax=Nocardioides alkalitolerans TaxID=281714 RepID=UPI000403D3FB|nr:ATP-binding protein [Nocardioides alkalitolerans]